MSRSLRLPLVTGYEVLAGFMMIGAFCLPVLTLLALSIPLVIVGHWFWGISCFVGGVFFLVVTVELGRDAWAGRPSDFVLTGDELAIHGGPARGLAVKLADVNGATSCIAKDKSGKAALELAMRDGKRHVLGRGLIGEDEEAFLDVIRAATGSAPREHAAGGEPRLEIVACPSCNAPQVPAETATAPCSHCGEPCAMPERVRDRVREVRKIKTLDRKVETMLRRMLAQPSARSSFLVFVAAAVVASAAWLFAVTVIVRALLAGELDGSLGARALVFPIPVGIVVLLLCWRWLASRQAVQAVMLKFGATAPADAKAAPGCHSCGGPLEVERGALVVGCAYCGSPNILGIDLPRDLRTPQQTHGALTKALAQRTTDVGWTTKALAIAGPLALAVAFVTGRYLVLSHDERLVERCELGPACFSDALDESRPAADRLVLMRAACTRDHALACLKLGAWQHEGKLGLGRDPAAALVLFERGCKLGHSEACEIVRGLARSK